MEILLVVCRSGLIILASTYRKSMMRLMLSKAQPTEPCSAISSVHNYYNLQVSHRGLTSRFENVPARVYYLKIVTYLVHFLVNLDGISGIYAWIWLNRWNFFHLICMTRKCAGLYTKLFSSLSCSRLEMWVQFVQWFHFIYLTYICKMFFLLYNEVSFPFCPGNLILCHIFSAII